MFTLTALRKALAIIAVINVIVTGITLTILRSKYQATSFTYEGVDYPLWFPTAPREPVAMTLQESVQFTLEGGQSVRDYLGLREHAPGAGWLRLGPEYRTFGLPLMHSSHCLPQLHYTMWDPNENVTWPGHIQHCLDYIRQLVLCRADSDLEDGDFMTRNYATDRVTGTTVCENWLPIYDALEAHLLSFENEYVFESI